MSHVFTAHIVHIYDGVACVVHVYTGGEYNSHATCAYSFSMHVNLFIFMQYFKLFEEKKNTLRHEVCYDILSEESYFGREDYNCTMTTNPMLEKHAL